MTAPLDRAERPRDGEELDRAKLGAYLAGLGLHGELEVRQFPKGHSNLTYLVVVGDRELVLRRPPFGSKVKTAHDMGREHRILSALSGTFPCPKPIAFCEDESVLGAKFYVMDRIVGTVLRKDLPAGLSYAPDALQRLHGALVDTLADLHAVDPAKVGLADLGKPEGYVERQVTGWTKRWEASKTDEVPDADAIARWLADRMPKESGATLIHNDYKLDNVVLDPADPTRIVGVLDWEMATLGDPLMDLGTTLSYWIERTDPDPMQLVRWGPTTGDGAMTRRELADRYAARTGRDLSGIVFQYCFGLFKTAIVLQQIYFRYVQGLTKDPRFAQLGFAMQILVAGAVRAAERGTL